jgi:hypothetical protein
MGRYGPELLAGCCSVPPGHLATGPSYGLSQWNLPDNRQLTLTTPYTLRDGSFGMALSHLARTRKGVL